MSILLPKYKNFEQEHQVGEYTIILPDPPDIKKIANKDLPKKDQRFYAPDKRLFKNDDFISQEWERRENGFWFWNNGNLEYITGTHYFYIGYWGMTVTQEVRRGNKTNKTKKWGLPSFIDSNRDYFYLWDYCVYDPDCYGMIYLTNRRDGKTERANCIVYKDITENFDVEAGIQSKTSKDGAKVFKKMVKVWNRLPDFWRPIHDGNPTPKTSLNFEEPSIINKKNFQRSDKKALNSYITYGSANEEEFDGSGLFRFLHDEIGKTKVVNVNERWKIVKETLVDGDAITGKSIHTTTVEDMENKGGKHCKQIWDDSDPNELDGLGRTKSGLHRLFKPAYYGFRGEDKETGERFVDEYGYSNIELAKKYFEKKREPLSGNDLISEQRKYPFNVREAFMSDAKSNLFDVAKVNEQLHYNETLPPSTVVTGNFHWKNDIPDTEVVWRPAENGRWKMAWAPSPKDQNKIDMRRRMKFPGNDTDIVSGSDPYDSKLTPDGKTSLAGSYVLRKYDPHDPHNSHIFALEYLYRHYDPDMFFEDMIMQCVFYGCKMFPESNRGSGLINMFERRGYSNYLMNRTEETQSTYSRGSKTRQNLPGAPMTGEVPRNALVSAVSSYITNYVGYNEEGRMGKLYFNDLLDQFIKFEPDNWTPYDGVVAAGMTLLAAKETIDRPVREETTTTWKSLTKRYKYEGGKPIKIDG